MARAAGLAEARAVRYRFCPRPARVDPEERDRFLGRLRAALRVARGLGSGFTLEWQTGPAGGVTLEATGANARVWTAGLLFGAYAPDQWRPEEPRPSADRRVLAVGTAGASPDLPLPAAVGPLSWAEGAVAALVRLAAGAAVLWEARPAPVPRRPVPPAPRPVEPAAPDRGQRLAPASAVERGLRDATEAKRLAPAWEIRARLTAESPRGAAVARDLARIVESASQFDGGNTIRLRSVRPWRSARGVPIWFSEAEALALWPSAATEAGLPAEAVRGLRRLPIGRRADGGAAWIGAEPHQGRHAAVVGETGMGKSSCLIRLGWAARALGGVVLLDPLGETARGFLGGIPERERERVVWVSARDAPVGINALGTIRATTESERARTERAVGDLVQALRRVRSARFPERSFWGPRLEEMLGRSLALAARLPGGTLEDAHRLLEEARPLESVGEPALRHDMAALARRVRERPDDAEGARRLLAEVVRSSPLRKLLCARRPDLAVSDAVGPGRIFVLSGDAADVGEPVARYLLAVWLALLWAELLSRGPSAKTTVLLDESQWYAHEALSEMLRLGRHRNVHAVVATQNLASWPEDVREAVLANVADFVVFRGSPDDARAFARWTDLRWAGRLAALPRGHALLFRGKGSEVEPIAVRPISPSPAAQLRARAWGRQARPGWPESGSVPATEDGRSDARGAAPEAGPPRAEKGTEAGPVSEDPIFDWVGLRACYETPPAGSEPGLGARSTRTVRVSLAALRERYSDRAEPDEAVRRVGARLGRAGAIVARGRDARGPFWILDPESVAGMEREGRAPPGPPSDALGTASRRDEN